MTNDKATCGINFLERYEELRSACIVSSGSTLQGSNGVFLFLTKGMAAWMPCLPAPDKQTLASEKVGFSDASNDALVMALANMGLALCGGSGV